MLELVAMDRNANDQEMALLYQGLLASTIGVAKNCWSLVILYIL